MIPIKHRISDEDEDLDIPNKLIKLEEPSPPTTQKSYHQDATPPARPTDLDGKDDPLPFANFRSRQIEDSVMLDIFSEDMSTSKETPSSESGILTPESLPPQEDNHNEDHKDQQRTVEFDDTIYYEPDDHSLGQHGSSNSAGMRRYTRMTSGQIKEQRPDKLRKEVDFPSARKGVLSVLYNKHQQRKPIKSLQHCDTKFRLISSFINSISNALNENSPWRSKLNGLVCLRDVGYEIAGLEGSRYAEELREMFQRSGVLGDAINHVFECLGEAGLALVGKEEDGLLLVRAVNLLLEFCMMGS
ncbi:hypothetical protein EJ08DRAFT_691221 [Tothia fuscella]|uniref:Uncharacterized protein n=1 Tax=Tothia fuscella TaxID=1048955 RepID=A0A9P4U5A8_9PEZI|nr:hypothetical protein EJ08DRAFT_691221 [Tothia fuscella]